MNKININLEHCFGITKLSQRLDFAGENVALIYAPNGLMKTSFAKTLKLYGQEKTNKVKDVVADIAGTIEIKDEQGNVVLRSSYYVKTKAPVYAFIYVCAHPLPLHQNGTAWSKHCKDN